MGVPVEVINDDDLEATEVVEDYVPRAPEPPAALRLADGPQSILGEIRKQVDGRTTKATVVQPVGIINGLSCRYRAISDERREQIGAQVEAIAGDNLTMAAREMSAAVLASACETLLWQGKSLHEVLEVAGPLRYGREVAEMLGLDVGEKPSTVEVVVALHQLGESTAPLETAAEDYLKWLTGKRSSAVEWALSR